MPLLTDHRQELFCRLVAEGKPVADAFREAGFGKGSEPHVQAVNGGKMARRVAIAARITELRSQAAAHTTITSARVLEEMAKIGFANMMDYIRVQEDGTAAIDMSMVDRDKGAAISEVIIDEFMDGKGDNIRPVKRIRLKLHDKRAALVDIGKHFGMFVGRVEHSGPGGGPIDVRNKVEVSLLSRDERDMLKQLLLLAAERKRGQEVGIAAPSVDAEYEVKE